MPRIRYRDQTFQPGPPSVVEVFQKPNQGCTGTPVWETNPASFVYPYVRTLGTYSHFIDVNNNPPKRRLGSAGYTFNGMDSAVVTSPPGSDTGWQVSDVTQSCVGSGPYYRSFRRRFFGGVPLSNMHFDLHVVGIGGLTPNVIDLTSYGLPYAEIERMRALVATSVRSKRGRGSDTNLWESVAEVNKTLGMLGDYMHKARSISKAAFSRRAARDLTVETAGAYLMTRYGFQPLVKDIFTTLLALEEGLHKRLERTRAQETSKSLVTENLSDVTDGATFNFTRKLTTSYDLVVRAVSVDEYVLSMMQRFGLGSKNLFTVPYELVKFSFVLDWFANVGDFIGALAPEIGLTHIGGCTSVHLDMGWTGVLSPTGLLPGKIGAVTVNQAPSVCVATRSLKYASRDTGLPAPAIRIQSDFKFDKLLRAADAASLLVQQLSNFRPKGHH
jgi:hypothetical protein